MPDDNTHSDVQGRFSAQELRNHLLASDRHSCVQREVRFVAQPGSVLNQTALFSLASQRVLQLWNNGSCTYSDLRTYIISQTIRNHVSHPPSTPSLARRSSTPLESYSTGLSSPAPSFAASPSMSFQPSAAYTFVGMRCVFDAGKAPVTLVRFANVRADLLAYADADGNLWLVRDVQGSNAQPVKAPPIHRRAITSLDWSPDNTYLLTASLDGLTVWDVAELSPVRTVATPSPANAITSAVFHCLSANLVLVGTAKGTVDVYNISTGASTLSVPIFKKLQKGVSVSALEISAHHVFVGDNTGWLHLHKQDIPRPGQLANLVHMSRVRVPASDAAAPIVGCSYLPFCQATGSPALLVTARDSTLAIVKVVNQHLLEIHTRCGVAPMAREIRAVCCPLSVLHCDLPRVVMGSEDTGVHIYNLSAIKAPGAAGTQKGGVAGGYKEGALGRPLLVNTLRGHRAPVASISWAFDETLLASADWDGMVIVWQRDTATGV